MGNLRENIEQLSEYLSYLTDATKESVVSWVNGGDQNDDPFYLTYPVYDRTFVEFVDELYETDLLLENYNEIIMELGLTDERDLALVIDEADMDVVRAILTYFIRQERFQDGLWAEAVEQRVFLNVLKRLRELIGE